MHVLAASLTDNSGEGSVAWQVQGDLLPEMGEHLRTAGKVQPHKFGMFNRCLREATRSGGTLVSSAAGPGTN